MTADPRAALATLVSALERHLEAAGRKRGENDPVVFAAYQDVAEAFDAYDDALLDAYDEVTPLEVYHGTTRRTTPTTTRTTTTDDDEDGGTTRGDDVDDLDDEDWTSWTPTARRLEHQGLDDEEYDEDTAR